MQKQCFKCLIIKPLSDFYKHPQMPDGTVNKCKECNKTENKSNWHLRREDKLAYDKNRHRFSIQRLFNHRYYGIVHRCEVGRSKRHYFVEGKSYLSKKEWEEWCYETSNYKKFIEIYNNWVKSNFENKLSPSVDRIKNNKSYTKDNIQWLTKSENCQKFNK